MTLKEADGIRADKVATTVAATGATITLVVVTSKAMAVVQCAITSTREADRRRTASIRVLAVGSLAIRDGYRLSVDKVAIFYALVFPF